jgi:hypothetical protein
MVSGGGAGKQSGKGYFNILDEGETFKTDGRVGWAEEIDLGPGPLEF